MSRLKERVLMFMQDPRVTRLMRNPRVQELAVRAFRLRGRVEGAANQQLERIAGRLNLATQKDLRAMNRRIRHLERELREAEERFNEAADAREGSAHS